MNEKLFDYIAVCPTAFHTCAHSADMLRESGYTELCEAQRWEIVPGGKYFVTRNGSSLIAFRVPAGEIAGFMMTAAHGDSPAFKIKENAELPDGNYLRLSVEKYGGMLCAPWLDRPLSVAGSRIRGRQAFGEARGSQGPLRHHPERRHPHEPQRQRRHEL